ncbi:lysophospholipid acyltransferase family protein [Pseudomonadota bacterium]
MLVIRSSVFTIGLVLAIVVYTPVCFIVFPFPAVLRSRIIGLWARFIMRFLKLTCNLDYEVKGMENAPSVPTVILSKHQSAWETIAFQAIFPPQAWVLKRELLWLPLFGWALAATRPIAINRATPRKALDQVVKQGHIRLKQGRWVVVFPEGTRIPPGEMGKYNPGGALLAVKSGVPVLPVAHNAGRHWPAKGFLKKPGTIKVIIGPAIDTRNKRAKEVNQQAFEWTQQAMEGI